MQFHKFTEPAAFLAFTQPHLERAEAANNLMLGLATRLVTHRDRFKHPPYLATVSDGAELVAAALMTPPRDIIVYSGRPEREAALRLIAEDLHAANWPLPGVNGPAEDSAAFARIWAELTGAKARIKVHMRVYELREVIPPARPAPGVLRVADLNHLDLIVTWLADFEYEALGNTPDRDEMREALLVRLTDGDHYLWEVDGQPVSLTAVGRRTRHGVSIGPVYTPPEQRGHGYASMCVAGVSQRILDTGRVFCALFTDLANPTSNHIYMGIGYRPLGDFDDYAFEA